MFVIPIQPVPSQQVLCVLEGQNCQIGIYVKNVNGVTNVYVDLNSNGADMSLAVLAHNLVPLDSANSYNGFQGNLFFVDTQGSEDPQYTGFNSRWFLVYLTPAELELTVITPEAVLGSIPNLTLSATLNVTAPTDGNFSLPHGLTAVPFIIEIVPTSPGTIWGQAGFADATNINLVGSEAGITATVFVYTVAADGVTLQTPIKTLTAVSSAPGPFSVAHGLGTTPSHIEILPTSAGAIWAQTPEYDDTNIYLEASDADQSATISVYGPVTGALSIGGPATILTLTASAPGPIVATHGLSASPSRIEILMISGGLIWAQTPAFDAANVYLEASDAGVIAKISVYP